MGAFDVLLRVFEGPAAKPCSKRSLKAAVADAGAPKHAAMPAIENPSADHRDALKRRARTQSGTQMQPHFDSGFIQQFSCGRREAAAYKTL